MGNAAIAEELTGIDELDELYKLDASESEPEDDDEDGDEDDEADDDEGVTAVEPHFEWVDQLLAARHTHLDGSDFNRSALAGLYRDLRQFPTTSVGVNQAVQPNNRRPK